MARSDDVSRPASSGRTPIQMVGTPAARVTSSDSIISASLTGTMFGPGMTSLAPDATPAWASPQALAWNIGTTGRTTSLSQTPTESASIAPIVCRNVLRCV